MSKKRKFRFALGDGTITAVICLAVMLAVCAMANRLKAITTDAANQNLAAAASK